jgi:hypothetical protein
VLDLLPFVIVQVSINISVSVLDCVIFGTRHDVRGELDTLVCICCKMDASEATI